MKRREALRLMAGATVAVGAAKSGAGGYAGGQSTGRSQLGIVTYALGNHRRQRWAGRHAGVTAALALLEEARRFGAGGIQVDLTAKDRSHLSDLRECTGLYGMHLEAIIGPPKDDADLGRFEQAIRDAKEAGATLARTVVIPGRRYERFQSLTEFREFERRGELSLQRVEPILRRHKFRLAVENHKDQRTWEKLAMLERVSSEFIGMCVDVGNNLPLMEDPLEVVRAFAPWAMTVHLKDQGIREYEQGFLLADMALGEGCLELPEMVKVLRAAKPNVCFNLETITRDAIQVPILTDGFWSTMSDTPASALARMTKLLKTRSNRGPFPVVSKMNREEQLALEQRNVQRSLVYAIEILGL